MKSIALVALRLFITLPAGAVARYCNQRACVCVCLSVREDIFALEVLRQCAIQIHIRNDTHAIFANCCACCLWPWLVHPLAGEGQLPGFSSPLTIGNFSFR